MSQPNPCELSIIMPARHEAPFIAEVISAYAAHFTRRYGRTYELVVVVNGSTDATEQVAASLAEQHETVRVMTDPGRIGKGGAVRLGFQSATGRLIGFVDADGSTGPAAFQVLVDHMDAAEAVLASRWMPGARIHSRQPVTRRAASRVLNWITRHLLHLPVHDTQCGAKCFDGRFFREHILPVWQEDSWAFDIELLCRIQAAGGRLIEQPTEWTHVHKSGGRNHRIWFEMAGSLLRVIRRCRKRT